MASEAAQINLLQQRLAQRIRTNGPISVADYMDEVSGFYYGTRDPFGVAGDFTTAPEISQIFGELIGAWCADYWQRMGAPDPVLLIELGPGRGTLMADALRATRHVPGFHRALQLHLVERSPALRRLQQEKLAEYAPVFHGGVATLPQEPMLLIANEFLDALPIRQYERGKTAWHERKIGLSTDGKNLAFHRDQKPVKLGERLDDSINRAIEGAIVESCSEAETLGEVLGGKLLRFGGAALFVDYGYSGAGAHGDTLQAVRRHHLHAVLDNPGDTDLTAHVDFTAFAAAAHFGGTEAYGPVTQRAFLSRLGIEARATRLMEGATTAQAEAIKSGCHRLTDPGAMGDLFKVLALGKKGAPAPAGFGVESS